MVKVSVFYPTGNGTKFDMEYYCKRHIPLVQRLLGSALKGASVDAGLSGEEPGTPATYVAMGHLLFDSLQSFQSSFGTHVDEIVADVPKYTNVKPIIQISEIKL